MTTTDMKSSYVIMIATAESQNSQNEVTRSCIFIGVQLIAPVMCKTIQHLGLNIQW